jgi:hypothetical protein
LLLANWFDAGVVADAKIRAGSTYDSGPLMNAVVLARLLTAAGVIAVVAAGWWTRSNIAGIGYVAVGGFVATLPATVWAFAFQLNGKPPVLPDAIARPMNDWFFSLEAGVTGAVYTISGAMFIVGLAILGSNLLKRRAQPAAAVAPAAPEAQPSPQTPLT